MPQHRLDTGPREFCVLVVCTGNICRSPLAAQLLSARLAVSPVPFAVSSAGTAARPGAPMDETSAEQSRARGGAPGSHGATRLTEEVVRHADLVLVAAREHRAAVVRLAPRVARRTFTLEEFARLAGSLDPADLGSAVDPEAVVALVAGTRGTVRPPDDPGDDDVVDPYRRSVDVHEQAAADIDRTVDAVVRALRAPHDA